MERIVICFQKPSTALWLSSHFVEKIDPGRVVLVGLNLVEARAIYGLSQAKVEHQLKENCLLSI